MVDEFGLEGRLFKFEEDETVFRAESVRESGVDESLEAQMRPIEGLGSRTISVSGLERKAAEGGLQGGFPDPRVVHSDRSEYAQAQDVARDAEITTDPEEYATDPNSFDFPGVDTGPTFREAQEEEFDTEAFLENLF